MQLTRSLALVSSALFLSLALPAQTTVYFPAGGKYQDGGRNNTIPFWGVSGAFQQVMDASVMNVVNGGKPMIIKGMTFRMADTFSAPAHIWDIEISMGVTSITSATMTTTFSTNLGTSPTKVIPLTTFSFAAVKGTATNPGEPNQDSWVLPFKTSFIYVPANFAANNLIFEWRHKNNSSGTTSSPMDRMSGNSAVGRAMPSEGRGCTPTGGISASTASMSGTTSTITAMLSGAAASTKLIMAAGLVRQKLAPGWCSAVELRPLVYLAGATNAAGTWTLQQPHTVFDNTHSFELLMQFAYTDSGQPGGLGLSDMAVYRTPLRGGSNVSRIYATGDRTMNGLETATTGSVAQNWGYVVGFIVP